MIFFFFFYCKRSRRRRQTSGGKREREMERRRDNRPTPPRGPPVLPLSDVFPLPDADSGSRARRSGAGTPHSFSSGLRHYHHDGKRCRGALTPFISPPLRPHPSRRLHRRPMVLIQRINTKLIGPRMPLRLPLGKTCVYKWRHRRGLATAGTRQETPNIGPRSPPAFKETRKIT